METRNKIQQCDQNKESKLDLAEYVIWKSNTKLITWVSLNIGIYLDLSLMFSYFNQIILYRNLHTY